MPRRDSGVPAMLRPGGVVAQDSEDVDQLEADLATASPRRLYREL